jgi:flagellar motor switch protein FliM
MNPDDDLSQQEVLSQAEVERLLAQVTEVQGSVVVHKLNNMKERQPKDSIQPYDFRTPVFLSASELRKLRLHHENFIRSLAARFSIYLRLEFGLQMSKLQTITYQRFVDTLGNPGHLTLFKIEPLRGISILDIHPRLGLTFVDRLMGGPAHSVNHDRDLREIEVALLDQAVQVLLGEWCSHWSHVQELRPTILGHETNGRFLETASPDTVMLALTMEARFGDCMEEMQIGFPYYMLEPLIRNLGKTVAAHSETESKAPPAPIRWNQRLDEVNVNITAEWNGLEMTARELLKLRPGDVLQLDPACAEEVRMRVANLPKFTGRLGNLGKHWAVQINEILKA